MNRYASWSGLKKQLTSFLCPELQGRVDYFLTRYHAVHNAYGRASVKVDGQEVTSFTWWDMALQDADVNALWKETREWKHDDPALLAKWTENETFSEWDFLQAATDYLSLPVSEALNGKNPLLRMFGILDRRVGKRTLARIKDEGKYLQEPQWLRQFYELRLGSEGESGISEEV